MGNWSFLHPALLAGLAGVTIPLVIHLIGRRRAPTVRFAAFDFLMSVNKRLARRERLRQFLLLLLRALAIAATVLAVARPTLSQSVVAPTNSRRLALVIDHSASMNYRQNGSRLLDRAKRLAQDVIAGLQPGDAVALALAGDDVRTPYQAPNADLAAVRRAIDQVEIASGSADLGAAIEVALAQLGDDAAGVELVVIGDLARNSFTGIQPTSLDPPPQVRLVDAAERDEPRPLGNLAIEGVEVARSIESASERIFVITVRNYGDEAITRRPLEFRIDDKVTQRSFVTVGPRATEEKRLTVRFEGTGNYRVEARVSQDDDDGFQDDDRYRLQVELHPGVRVLAVNGDPRTTPYEDELFFLERALQTQPRGEAPITLQIVAADELALGGNAIDFSSYDAVLLANVSELPRSVISGLEKAQREGKGLIFALGPRVDFEQANAAFADLLPMQLRDLFRAEDEVTGAPPLAIGELDTNHPILLGLDDAFGKSLRSSRSGRYFNVDVGGEAQARTVLRFENGAPALLERVDGDGGRVLLFTTSIDVDMSDIALRSAFPALIQRSTRYVAGALSAGNVVPVRQGAKASLPLPTGTTALRLLSPDEQSESYEIDDDQQRFVETKRLDRVGYYRTEVRDSEWRRVKTLDVPVNVTLAESDFMPVQVERVSKALAGEDDNRSVSVRLGSQSDADPLSERGPATYLLLALALFFLAESVLASRG